MDAILDSKEELFMCSIKQYKCFMLAGCVTYTSTLAAFVFNIIYIVKGIVSGVGVWLVIGTILISIVLLIIGCGLGLLFQSFGYFAKKFSKCKYNGTNSLNH